MPMSGAAFVPGPHAREAEQKGAHLRGRVAAPRNRSHRREILPARRRPARMRQGFGEGARVACLPIEERPHKGIVTILATSMPAP
jgi:hypothetical protein